MLIEGIKVNTTSIGLNASNTDKVSRPQILQDDILNISKKDDADKKGDKKESDKVELSPEAQSFLKSSQSNSAGSGVVSGQTLQDQALQYRGLSQISQRRELTSSEQERFTAIKENFASLGIDEGGITRVADRYLQDLQVQAVELVSLIDKQQITGSQFNNLNKINKLLNDSNGFSSSQVEGALQTRADQLTEAFNKVVSAAGDKTLNAADLSNLEKLQKEMSDIQGYQLNVRDSIGSDGIMV